MQSYHCNKFFHYERECRMKQAYNNSRLVNYGEKYSYKNESLFLSISQEENYEDKTLLSKYKLEYFTNKTWVLDSGCTNNMTKRRELLSYQNDSFSFTIKLGNEKILEVIAKGDMEAPTKSNNIKVKGIYYSLDLKHSLLSVRKMLEKN